MKPKILFPILTVFSLATSAHAGLLVHEQFLTSDYTSDATVVGQSGGTGFTGVWSQTGGLAAHVDFYPRTTGLNYPGLATDGGAIEHYRLSGTAATKRANHDISFTPVAVTGEAHLYIGFLFEVSNGAAFSWIYSGAANNRDSVLTVDAAGAVSFEGGGTSGSTLNLGTIQAGTNMVLLRTTDATSGSPNNAFYDEIEGWLNPDLQNLGTADDTGYAITSKFDGGNNDLTPQKYLLSAALAPGESILFDEFFVTDDLSTVLDSTGEVDPPEISAFDYDPVADTIRITWDSEPGRTYTLRWSPDLSDWTASVATGIASQGATTTYPPVGQPATPNPAPLSDALFFRVDDDGPLP